MTTELFFLIIGILYAIINTVAFVYVLTDKSRAVRGSNHNRIPESKLLFFSICFGALGILFSMHLVRHKTKTLSFVLGVPLALAQNILTLFLVYTLFT